MGKRETKRKVGQVKFGYWDHVRYMIIYDLDSIDVYYQIAGTAFQFAFGIPHKDGIDTAELLAVLNVDMVEMMFHE